MTRPHPVGVGVVWVPHTAPVEAPLAGFRAFRCSDDLFDKPLGGAETDSSLHGGHGEVPLVFGEELTDCGVRGYVGVHEPSDAFAYLVAREVFQLEANSLGGDTVEQFG